MKKIITFSAALILGVCAFGVRNYAKEARAEILASDLQNLLTGYNDGGYTKRTTLYLTETAKNETQYFHAGANALQRATYYKADNSALLMGDFDGGFEHINSGYMNDGEGNAVHFTYEGTGASSSDLFTNIETGWKANGQTVGGYYQTLSSLAGLINAGDWDYDGNYDSFVHNISSLTLTDGEYSDPLLKAFQYFAAPMMLQNSYFSWKSIRVTNTDQFLSIRLYSSSSDSTKSTIVGETECLISEARVYKGLVFSAPVERYYLKGSIQGVNKWSSEDLPMTEMVDIYAPKQFKIDVTLNTSDELKVFDAYGAEGTWYGHSDLENTDWFFGSDNIGVKLNGDYTIYWKAKHSNRIYISVPEDGTVTVKLNLVDNLGGASNNWTTGNAEIWAWAWGGTNGGTWYKASSYTNLLLTDRQITALKLVRFNPSAANKPTAGSTTYGSYVTTGDNKDIWNETGNITLAYSGTLTMTGWGSAEFQ